LSARPRAILFDWDNTLVDTWPALHESINAALEAFGQVPWTFDETRKRVRKSMRDSFPDLFGANWEEAGEVFYQHFAAIHLEKLEARPGAEGMLRQLKAAGIYLGIVSNKNGDYLRREAAHLGWDSYFGQIVGAFDAKRDKPASDPVDLALQGSGIAPGGEVWLAGDDKIDLECAVNAGCVPILVRETGPEAGEFDGHPPHRHFHKCQELSNLVEKL